MKKYTANQISRMATDIAYAGKVDGGNAMRVMEMLLQGAAAIQLAAEQAGTDQEGPKPMSDRTKADLLYCMDYIMHHLSDSRKAIEWAGSGMPETAYDSESRPPSESYARLDVPDYLFDAHLATFTRILARHVIPGIPDLSDYHSREGALC